MNYKKTIKDLKEFNSKLKGQYNYEQNRNYCLQCKIDRLEKEKQELKEQLERSEKARKEAIEFIKEYEKNQNLLKWNEEDYIDVINGIKKYLDIDKGE